ncbi:winged helix-turn-helix domain-containing protein [Pedobacter sp. L105]|uniref:winged helix-turn-helix domain-containing protein n=1 Tax=Pedobacter sp. L105 TaxID=1641871 RepID=UPI00131D3D98|nr:winged helix-turn-helix domain-containing protein [Pedobacter sp. L105]
MKLLIIEDEKDLSDSMKNYFEAGCKEIVIGGLVLDLKGKALVVDGLSVLLTRKEFKLLTYLITNRNRVVTKEAIIDHLWGDDVNLYDNYDSIYSHIKNLRNKLIKAGCPDYIKAIYGMGYKFIIPVSTTQ